MFGCDWAVFLTSEDDVCWQIVVATWLLNIPLMFLAAPTLAVADRMQESRESREIRQLQEALDYHDTGRMPVVPWYERLGCVYHLVIGLPAMFAYLGFFILAIARTAVFIF